MIRLRSTLLLAIAGVFLAGLTTPVQGQSVDAVVDKMRASHEKQLETVDSYIIKTNLYTSYTKKVTTNGEPTYQTETKMSDDGPAFASTTSRPTAYGLHFDRLKKHATYGGTTTVNGANAHVLHVDDPGKMDPEMGDQASSLTYYIDANRFLPARMVMTLKGQQQQGGAQAPTVTVNMMDYNTVDGLTVPYRMEIQYEMDMSKKQKDQMRAMMKKMEDMPAQQREQMKRMMGGEQMDMMKQMLSGDPVVVEVQDVQVNVPLPDDVF